jgi:hypothetical protein
VNCFPEGIEQQLPGDNGTWELTVRELQDGKKPSHHERHHRLGQGHVVEARVINFLFKADQMVVDISAISEANQAATVLLVNEILFDVHLV